MIVRLSPTSHCRDFCCCCSCLAALFLFFFRSKTKNLPPQQREEPQVPLTHIPCSASLWLGTGLGGRRLTRVITGCLWPTESSWGPLRCEFVHPWECGPCCAANGPYPRCPPSACPRRWLTAALVSDLFCRAFLRRFPSWGMRLRAQSEKKEKNMQCLESDCEQRVRLHLTYISHHRHCSRA